MCGTNEFYTCPDEQHLRRSCVERATEPVHQSRAYVCSICHGGRHLVRVQILRHLLCCCWKYTLISDYGPADLEFAEPNLVVAVTCMQLMCQVALGPHLSSRTAMKELP